MKPYDLSQLTEYIKLKKAKSEVKSISKQSLLEEKQIDVKGFKIDIIPIYISN